VLATKNVVVAAGVGSVAADVVVVPDKTQLSVDFINSLKIQCDSPREQLKSFFFVRQLSCSVGDWLYKIRETSRVFYK